MAKANQEKPLKIKARVADPEAYELVEVTLIKDRGKYKHDLYIAVNDHRYRIKRGEPVKVPRFIYEVLTTSSKQDAQTADRIGKLTAKSADMFKQIGE